jgi:hypothetical protein
LFPGTEWSWYFKVPGAGCRGALPPVPFQEQLNRRTFEHLKSEVCRFDIPAWLPANQIPPQQLVRLAYWERQTGRPHTTLRIPFGKLRAGCSARNIRHPTSDIPHPTSHIRHPTSHIRLPTSDIPHPTSHIPHPTSPTCSSGTSLLLRTKHGISALWNSTWPPP